VNEYTRTPGRLLCWHPRGLTAPERAGSWGQETPPLKTIHADRGRTSAKAASASNDPGTQAPTPNGTYRVVLDRIDNRTLRNQLTLPTVGDLTVSIANAVRTASPGLGFGVAPGRCAVGRFRVRDTASLRCTPLAGSPRPDHVGRRAKALM
jgi:hypothetical protein